MENALDMNMEDLLDENSDFIKKLQKILSKNGIELNAITLSKVLNEYEFKKLDLLKANILELLNNNQNQELEKKKPLKIILSNQKEEVDNEDALNDTNLIC